MHARVLLLIYVALCAAGASGTACAQNLPAQPLETIRSAAQRFARSQLPTGAGHPLVTAATLDPRLRLAPCAGELTAAVPAGSTPRDRLTVGVSCRAPNWTVYVPVVIESEVQMLVLRRPVAQDARLNRDDVETQTRRIAGTASDYIRDASQLALRHARRALPAGTALTADLLAADMLVHRGQDVTLLAAASGIEVRAPGKALTDGALQQRVQVQNMSSLKIVEGVVDTADVVRVAAP
jgi:flagellar basal body P-ring formation protein FlgA